MDTEIVIFWLVVLSCVSGMVVTLIRVRRAGLGWVLEYGIILLLAVVGHLLKRPALLYAALAAWVALVLLPALLSNVYYRCFIQQRFKTARRLAAVIGFLHPADGWRQQPRILRALELAQEGNLDEATATLRELGQVKSLIGLAAVTNLYRLTHQWDELVRWQNLNRFELQKYPQLLPVLLRAYGETGDLDALAELYDRNKARIARLMPISSRDLCRLILFSFYGDRASVERLTSTTLAVLPAWAREFWIATAELAAGDSESAMRRLKALLPASDPTILAAVERRLAGMALPPAQLNPTARAVLDEAAREHSHDHSFGARPGLFSKHARVTLLLILINVLVFILEMLRGGSTNGETLFRMGALFPPLVRAGQWWRLVASLFLHLGPLHLVMNMFALWLLGPFVEFALGSRRYLLVYLIAGVGSMGAVMWFASGPAREQITVGASGCIMGLVGATGALMLRGWVRSGAASAKRRLISTLIIIGMQTAFDFVVPQVSMTAHLSGAVIGFAVTILLRARLLSPSQK